MSLGAGRKPAGGWLYGQVSLGPKPGQRSPDWQLGPNRLGSWHSWQAEPPKFSWQGFVPGQRGPSSATPTPALPGPYLAHTGPVPIYAIQAGPTAMTRGLSTPRALCGPHPHQNSAVP